MFLTFKFYINEHIILLILNGDRIIVNTDALSLCRAVEPKRLVCLPGVQGEPDDIRDHL